MENEKHLHVSAKLVSRKYNINTRTSRTIKEHIFALFVRNVSWQLLTVATIWIHYHSYVRVIHARVSTIVVKCIGVEDAHTRIYNICLPHTKSELRIVA